jgi:hypothetical protein
LEETWLIVLGCEFAADVRDARLNSREVELADTEQQLATTH